MVDLPCRRRLAPRSSLAWLAVGLTLAALLLRVGVRNKDQGDARAQGSPGQFVEYQSILTHGCHDVAYFTIDGAHYLAATAFFDDVSHLLESRIFRWNGYRFEPFQSIPTEGLVDWEFFTIDGSAYLALANHRDDSAFAVDSAIYRWDGARFVAFQSFATHQSQDWEFFSIDGRPFLVVNSNFSPRPSVVYRWNGTRFEEHQTLPFADAVYDWEFFRIDGQPFLAAALGRKLDPQYDLDSKVLRWDGGRFLEFQSLPTHGAHDWQFFTIGAKHYLAIANERGDAPGNADSEIFEWDGRRFVSFQTLPTRGARGLRFFTLFDDDYYLAVANRADRERNDFSTDSMLYRWDGSRFRAFQALATQGAEDWEFFTIDRIPYLAVANHRNSKTHNVGTKIYRWEAFLPTDEPPRTQAPPRTEAPPPTQAPPRFRIYLPVLFGAGQAPED